MTRSIRAMWRSRSSCAASGSVSTRRIASDRLKLALHGVLSVVVNHPPETTHAYVRQRWACGMAIDAGRRMASRGAHFIAFPISAAAERTMARRGGLMSSPDTAECPRQDRPSLSPSRADNKGSGFHRQRRASLSSPLSRGIRLHEPAGGRRQSHGPGCRPRSYAQPTALAASSSNSRSVVISPPPWPRHGKSATAYAAAYACTSSAQPDSKTLPTVPAPSRTRKAIATRSCSGRR